MSASLATSNRKAISLFLLRLIRSVISILTLILSARYFGVSSDRDAWLLAFNSIVVINLAFWGPLNETFRTQFIFIKEQDGESSAINRINSLFFFVSIISIFIVVVIFLYPNLYTSLIAPGKTTSELNTLTLILKLLLPSLLLNQFTLLLSSILNSYNIFYIPEIAGSISSIFNVLALLVLAPKIGIYSLVISYYFGLIVLGIFLFHELGRNKIRLFKPPFELKYSHVKPYLLYAIPFFFPYFFGQLNAIFEKSIASLLGDGIVSIQDYSRKFIDIPSGVLISVLTTVLVPILSKAFAQKNLDQFEAEFKSIFRLGLFVLGFLLSFFIMCSSDVVTLFYASKNIGRESLYTISTLSICYCVSVISVFYYSITGLALMSVNQGKIYATCGVLAQICMLSLNFLFYKKLGIYIFPASLFLAHISAALVMTLKLNFLTKTILINLLSYLIFTTALGFLCYTSNYYYFSKLSWNSLYLIIIKGTSLTATVIALLFILKMDERLFIQKGYYRVRSGINQFISK
ncbi:lipid II flippase MurJ [Dyadobacter sp. CY312]|uniref:lipid II flippase MurJ n=1 Tax=Dyadobacter sp. CY312 TaxID=2907303 RepID=UPI001F2EA1BF|nr:lipid II flippase MurJ [Dyadobacter sp. CY312]MCE7041280.1 hypothetical protein [Dyadobacter sp. CY312]